MIQQKKSRRQLFGFQYLLRQFLKEADNCFANSYEGFSTRPHNPSKSLSDKRTKISKINARFTRSLNHKVIILASTALGNILSLSKTKLKKLSTMKQAKILCKQNYVLGTKVTMVVGDPELTWHSGGKNDGKADN